MPRDCFICRTIEASERGENPGFIAKLKTGYVVLNSQGQYYRGYTIFQCRQCVGELHQLSPRLRSEFLREMSLVAEAMYGAFKPAKLNYELLGNTVPHLHWHLIPRYRSDPNPRVPAWENPEFRASQHREPLLSNRQLASVKRSLLRQLKDVAGPRIQASFLDV
ncbi:MAG: HIT family protein [Dehalococcoidia bacterium]